MENKYGKAGSNLFRNKCDHYRNQARIEINKGVISDYASNIIEVWSKGNSKIENALYHIHLGDWISWYLSEMNNVDAVEIDVIEFLKNSLAKFKEMQKVVFRDLGLIDYQEAWNYQEKIFNKIIEDKRKNSKEKTTNNTQSYLLFCEHPHVYTLGKSGDEKNLLVDKEYLASREAKFYKINRGETLPIMGRAKL